MSDIWFPGMKQPLHLSPDDLRRLEAVVLADQRAQEYDPEWERKLFLDFVEKHPAADINELAREFGKPLDWCKDRLHYFKLEELGAHCAAMRIIRPLNALNLARLTHGEQMRFVERAAKMAPADFRIVVDEFVRAKVMAIPLIVLTDIEIIKDAIRAMPVYKLRVAELTCQLRSAGDSYNELHAAYRRAVDPDPDRYYKD